MGTSATVRLMEGVCLIQCPLNKGFTVVMLVVPFILIIPVIPKIGQPGQSLSWLALLSGLLRSFPVISVVAVFTVAPDVLVVPVI